MHLLSFDLHELGSNYAIFGTNIPLDKAQGQGGRHSCSYLCQALFVLQIINFELLYPTVTLHRNK